MDVNTPGTAWIAENISLARPIEPHFKAIRAQGERSMAICVSRMDVVSDDRGLKETRLAKTRLVEKGIHP